MVRPGRARLAGQVEVDETFVGGAEEGGGRRHVGKKALVAIAVEVRGTAIGRIRLQRIRDSSAASLLPFVRQAVPPGSRVVTDGLQSYRGLAAAGYVHERKVIQGSGETPDALLPRVHRVASLLKRWLLGTHQGRPARAHLPYYLDEFTFRFNRRTARHRGLLFYRLLQQAVAVDSPIPYARLIGGSPTPGTTMRGAVTKVVGSARAWTRSNRPAIRRRNASRRRCAARYRPPEAARLRRAGRASPRYSGRRARPGSDGARSPPRSGSPPCRRRSSSRGRRHWARRGSRSTRRGSAGHRGQPRTLAPRRAQPLPSVAAGTPTRRPRTGTPAQAR